jgi:hypothetical protein
MSVLRSPIARRDHPNREAFLREFASTSTPVIITGAMKRWNSLSRWSLDFFRERYGSLQVPVQVWTTRRYEDMRFAYTDLRRYLERLNESEAGATHYLAAFDFFVQAPELAQDIEVPAYFDRRSMHEPLFFLAPAGVVTPLHYDLCHNVIAQNSGKKHFVLVSPRHGSLLYHPSLRSPYYWVSPVDAESPDLVRYPRFAGVEVLDCILEPGEMLFIPGGWWHQVRALEEGISLSFFFAHTLRQHLTRRVLGWLGRPQV